mmetsp:Transcript_25963/g.54840  ORF Transcript_25963/g.54840 Transcript_25963/m.54840 type:complete len:122 (-) Transcript_25963:125-490(-)
MPCSKARDMPNVLLPVPGHPLIKISFGGSFPFRSGGGELNVIRCFIEEYTEVSDWRTCLDCNCCLWLLASGTSGVLDGLKANAIETMQKSTIIRGKKLTCAVIFTKSQVNEVAGNSNSNKK